MYYVTWSNLPMYFRRSKNEFKITRIYLIIELGRTQHFIQKIKCMMIAFLAVRIIKSHTLEYKLQLKLI